MMPWNNELVTAFFLFADVIELQHVPGHVVPDAIGMIAAEWRHAWP